MAGTNGTQAGAAPTGVVERPDGARIAWFDHPGPANAPVLVLSNSLATDVALWAAVIERLAPRYRILAYDTRGHGASQAPGVQATLQTLRDDLLAVLDAAGVAQAVLVGISLGGMTALKCVLDAPDRVLGVVACNCRASIDAAGIAGWDQRLDILKGEGIDALAQATLARWFAQDYRDANPEVMARVRDIIRRTAPAGYESCIRAIQQVTLASRIDAIDRPVLLVAGAQDGAAPPAAMQAIADSIPGARLEVLDPCGHLSAIQQPDALASLIDGFCRTRHGGSLQ